MSSESCLTSVSEPCNRYSKPQGAVRNPLISSDTWATRGRAQCRVRVVAAFVVALELDGPLDHVRLVQSLPHAGQQALQNLRRRRAVPMGGLQEDRAPLVIGAVERAPGGHVDDRGDVAKAACHARMRDRSLPRTDSRTCSSSCNKPANKPGKEAVCHMDDNARWRIVSICNLPNTSAKAFWLSTIAPRPKCHGQCSGIAHAMAS